MLELSDQVSVMLADEVVVATKAEAAIGLEVVGVDGEVVLVDPEEPVPGTSGACPAAQPKSVAEIKKTNDKFLVLMNIRPPWQITLACL